MNPVGIPKLVFFKIPIVLLLSQQIFAQTSIFESSIRVERNSLWSSFYHEEDSLITALVVKDSQASALIIDAFNDSSIAEFNFTLHPYLVKAKPVGAIKVGPNLVHFFYLLEKGNILLTVDFSRNVCHTKDLETSFEFEAHTPICAYNRNDVFNFIYADPVSKIVYFNEVGADLVIHTFELDASPFMEFSKTLTISNWSLQTAPDVENHFINSVDLYKVYDYQDRIIFTYESPDATGILILDPYSGAAEEKIFSHPPLQDQAKEVTQSNSIIFEDHLYQVSWKQVFVGF